MLDMTWQETVNNLWIERLIWVRQLILGIILGLRDVGYVAQRLNRNSTEFGEILGSVYGPEAGNQFMNLLTQYISVLSEIVSTLKAGQDISLLLQQWEKTITDISAFLSQINPYWGQSTIYDLVKGQSQMELEFAEMLRDDKFSEAITNFDKSYDNAIYAARLMISGIENQFRS